jgi:glycerol-3-phosphate dehydrogenase
MGTDASHNLDALIIGGGIAGLWTLDALDERGFAVALLEPGALGAGQTLASQGIIHGGLKYTLRGLLHRSAEAVSAMPERWRQSLTGSVRPDLSSVTVRSPSTWLWRSESLRSKLGLLGARSGLRSVPIETPVAERPEVLRGAPGTVYRVDEPVLDTLSLVRAFAARHAERLIAVPGLRDAGGLTLTREGTGVRVELPIGPNGAGSRLSLRARSIILAAGAWNESLRAQLGLPPALMQRRPLHMAVVRSAPAELHGHCVDGAATRVTITTSTDSAGRLVWQLGGQLAEEGVALTAEALVNRAIDEVRAVLPGVDLRATEWGSYRIDRAERATQAGLRPDDAQIVDDDASVLTIWPTKLALAPRAAELVLDALRARSIAPSGAQRIDAPRPALGEPPWESMTFAPLGASR